MQVQIGDEEDTEFWNTKWWSECKMAEAFPRLFALESDPAAKVKDRIGVDVNTWQRRRNIRDGREPDEKEEMMTILEQISLGTAKDRWTVPNAPNGVLTSQWFRS